VKTTAGIREQMRLRVRRGERIPRGETLELLDDIDELRAENDALLSQLADSCDDLAAIHCMEDWPADTVLGEGGVQSIAELAQARGGIAGRLANYSAAEIAGARQRHKAVLDARLARARQKIEARRAEASQ